MSFGPGTLAIPNEADTNGGAIISAAAGSVLTANIPMGTGDCGAVLLNGIFCIGDKGATSHITSIPIYNPDLSLRATAVPFTPSSSWTVRTGMTSDYESTFYASIINGGSENLVRAFSTTGVTGGTTWHISMGGALILALSEDGSKFFYSPYGIASSAISIWNLGSDTSGGTLVAGVAGTDYGADLLRIPGTSNLIVVAQTAGPVFTVRRYNESGTLLMSYPLTGVTHEASATRLSVDLSSPDTFWVRTFDDISSTTTKFWQFDVATGHLVTSFTVPTDSSNPSKVPFSCPFFAWSASGSDLFIGSETIVAMKRVRRIPLPILPGNTRQTLGRVELQFQAGAGLAGNSAAAPQYVLAVSFNNGQTFGTARQMSAGLEGQFYARAYANALGTGRFPVLDISCTDDFNSVLTDVMVTMEPQTG